MCPSFKQEPVWRVCHRLKCRSRGRIVCKTLHYHLIPPQRCGPIIVSNVARNPWRRCSRIFEKKHPLSKNEN